MDSRKRIALIVAVALLIPGLYFLGGGSRVRAAGPVKMRLQTALPTASTVFKGLERLAEQVRIMSNGRLDIQVLPDGAIVRTAQIPDAVNSGLVDAAWTFGQYFAGKHIAGALFGAPAAGGGTKGGIDQFGHMTWLMIGPGRQLQEEFYRDVLKMNVVVFPTGFYGPLSVGWFAKPINSLKDLQTRRYRTGPGLVAETWKKLGVPATFLPGGEIVPAGQRGVLDGAQWGAPWDDMPLGFHQIWKHYYIQGAHFPISTGQILINKAFWDKLTPDLRTTLEVTTQALVLDSALRAIEQNGILLKEARDKHGVTVHDVPPDVFAAFAKAADETLDAYASDPFYKKVLESQREYNAMIRPWWVASLKSFVFIMEAAEKGK